jgi:hypothetical protein
MRCGGREGGRESDVKEGDAVGVGFLKRVKARD